MRNQDQAIGPHWKAKGPSQNSTCDPGCLFDVSVDESESHDLYHTRSDIVNQLMDRLSVVSKTGSPYNSFPEGPQSWYEPLVCAIKNETGVWLPLDFDGRPVPPAPPPAPPGPPTAHNCTAELISACPLNGSSFEVCLACTRQAVQEGLASDCSPADRHAYCGPDDGKVTAQTSAAAAAAGLSTPATATIALAKTDDSEGQRQSLAPIELHVDPTIGPFLSVEAARDHLRTLRNVDGHLPSGGARVVLHRGTHAPFILDPVRDSGTTGAPITYAAYGDGPAVVSGGVEVPASAFTSAAGKPGVFTADLQKLGLGTSDFGSLPDVGDAVHICDQLKYQKMQLFHEGTMTNLARFPNMLPNGDWQFMHAANGGNGSFHISGAKGGDRVLAWAKEEAPYAQGYWSFDWADGILKITDVEPNHKDHGKQAYKHNITVSVAGPAGPGTRNARWIGLNLLSELDVVGEYHISKAGVLSYMPASPPSSWKVNPVVSRNATCITIAGTQHVHIEGLEIAHCKATGIEAGNTVEQPGGNAQLPGSVTNVSVSNVTIHSIGGTGVDMRGHGSGIRDSVLHNIGCRAAVIHGGNATSLTRGNMFATGNNISMFALYKRTYMSGIHWAGVDNVYSHNTITDAPHNCMLGGGNEGDGVNCLFEHNSFDRCGFESSDTGAFYTCGQEGSAFVNRGNILRHSTFSNIRNTGGSGVEGITLQAVYLDDEMSGWHVWNCSFINCSTGTFVGGGSYNVIHDNYYEMVDTCQHFDARGKGHGPSCNASAPCVTTGNGGNCTCPGGAAYHMLHGPAGQEWNSSWGTEMQAVISDPKCVNNKGALPCHTQVVNNTYCRSKKFIDASGQATNSWNAVVKNNTEKCRSLIASKTDDVAAAPCNNASGDVWLSASGDDAHSGCSQALAVRTPQRAQALLHQHRSQLPLEERTIVRTVWVGAGIYELAETLQLTGPADSYTTWAAAPAAAVADSTDGMNSTMPVFSAGKQVRGFEPCGSGCPTNASGVFTLNLSAAAGLSSETLGSLAPRGWPGRHAPAPMELFTSPAASSPGTPQLLAQFPNHDMLGIASLPGGDYRPWMNGSTAWVGATHGGFTVRDSRLSQWDLNAAGQRGNAPWVHHAATWKDSHCKLGAVSAGANDTSTVLLSTDPDAGDRCLADPSRFDKFDVSSAGGMSRFYFYNVLSELDAAGEYFVDKPTGTLYWKPATPKLNLSAVVSVLPSVVSARNVTGVRFVGLAMLHSRGDAIEIMGSTEVELLDSTIANAGELGVNITNSSHSTVSDCKISQTGTGAVWLDGGDRDALISANLTLQRSNITRVSRWERFPAGRGAGVTLHGVGHTVLDNRFASIPHQVRKRVFCAIS